jgi:L-fucose isomerase-like protein
LLDLGIEIMENSELDLYQVFEEAKNDSMVKIVMGEIVAETGNSNSSLVERLARFEVALTRFYENNRGVSDFVVFANKCWPAFEPFFGFVPCYINSRMNGKGIPVACEVDVYGGLSQYVAQVVSQSPVTILDINNTVPQDLVNKSKNVLIKYKPDDLFMGFHCGNTPGSCLQACELRFHPLIHRLLEEGKEPKMTYGTLEGRLKPGKATMVRLHADFTGCVKAFIAEGQILDIDPHSFGGIGVFAVPEMRRFYRHVLLAKRFPHHTAVAFQHIGRHVFNALDILGITDISFNHPRGILYSGENPFPK